MRSRPHMLAVEQSFSPEWVHRFSARSAACSFLVRDRSTEYWTLQGMCNKQWFCNIMLGQSCLGRRQEAPPWPLGLLLAYSHLCKPFFWAAHEFPSFALYPSSLPHTAIFQLHVNCLHFLFLPWTNFLKALSLLDLQIILAASPAVSLPRVPLWPPHASGRQDHSDSKHSAGSCRELLPEPLSCSCRAPQAPCNCPFCVLDS